MRIDEFASAKEQLALWRLVNDNVWQAIETQRQQQAQAAQAKAAKAKLKPRKGRKGDRGKLSIPMPPPLSSPKAPQAKKPRPHPTPSRPSHRISNPQLRVSRLLSASRWHNQIQLQHPSHQQMRLQHHKTGYLPRNQCKKIQRFMGMTGIAKMVTQ